MEMETKFSSTTGESRRMLSNVTLYM